MNKKIISFGFCLLTLLFPGAVFAQPDNYQTSGLLAVTANEGETALLNPLNPAQEVIVKDPISGASFSNGEKGLLTIDYISNFKFSEYEKTRDGQLSFHSEKQPAVIKETQQEEDLPLFIQISDTRGQLGGWELLLHQDHQFTSDQMNVLNGAQVELGEGRLNDNGTGHQEDIVPEMLLHPDGEAVYVTDSSKFQGTTAFVYWKPTAVRLTVPSQSDKRDSNYRTSFHWQLADVPQA